MLLDRVISLIPEGNRRFPLKYIRMLNSIRDRYCLAKNKYLLAHPVRTPAVEMIRNILLNIDLNTLDGYKTDVDRYTEYIKYTGQNARAIFDPNFTNAIATGKFVENPNVKGEYMLETALAVGDEIKAVSATGTTINTWYPNGKGNNYVCL